MIFSMPAAMSTALVLRPSFPKVVFPEPQEMSLEDMMFEAQGYCEEDSEFNDWAMSGKLEGGVISWRQWFTENYPADRPEDLAN